MSKFEVVFCTNNAAFTDGSGEISRILRDIADRIDADGIGKNEPGRIRDINGNRVGFFNYDDNEESK